ncbi:UDP-N-acetylmuramoyl-L-alanine--D-glutamate ligase [Campylobacter sp. RM16187]|uniref:UDP-N-acetylmuramoyl-L-alanine--D-glutamate ligase n=1 Tax=Campylobacter sp. RM16187 TaxID=1660063 RepID=UPI0021B6A4C3|nr:UDP-N-acetylmuramoyl-L-alanine--D-glutamate ligase [Campylobacter sp. RM16187]QKG29978.1 UDP-N-acetylmuramoyl-L-alanine:D-glutamate ligase [Campylobacter sp. RM16187]
MKKSLFGYGGTIKAIAKNCLNDGIWDIYDDKFSEISKDQFGNNLLPVSKFDPQKSKLEILSPGFPPYHELVKKSQNLISEYDFFASKMPFSVWISGTNGKTTTTKMMQHLLEAKGSVMGGNVGTPLAELDTKAKIWILETSSFTLHYTNLAKPDIYVLLPITPDHLTWHGDMSSYEAAKLKPLGMMSENSVAIVPETYASTPTLAKVISYKNEEDLAKFCGVDEDEINFKVPFLMDALLALAVQKIIFDKCDTNLLNKFVIENNKLEEFSDKFGRTWVNDTKATNIDATIQALKRYKDKNLHLILGGDDKGVDMTQLFEAIDAANTKIYAIGSNSDKLIKLADKFKITAIKCEFLEVAVKEIAKNLRNDEIALLSPAAASLDQFSSYAERGDKFKEFVANL